MRADRDAKLVVLYDGERGELDLHGRPVEYVFGSGSFVLENEDESEKVRITIEPERYLLDQFGTLHVIVRTADLARGGK